MHLKLPTDGHLNAHADDFLLPLEDVLARVQAAITHDAPIGAAIAVYLTAETPLGWSRCVRAEGRRTWWGYRPDRSIPSHLAAGDREAVCVVTAWIRREAEDQATLITVYPGGPAPKEIHDPSLSEADRPEAEAFWTAHALIAPEPGRVWIAGDLPLTRVTAAATRSASAGAAQTLRVRQVPSAHAALLGQGAQQADASLILAPGDALLTGSDEQWFWVEVG
jgi:hypothetical protein